MDAKSNWKGRLQEYLTKHNQGTATYVTLEVLNLGTKGWRCNLNGYESDIHPTKKDAENQAAMFYYHSLIAFNEDDLIKNTSNDEELSSSNWKNTLQEYLAKKSKPLPKYISESRYDVASSKQMWKSYVQQYPDFISGEHLRVKDAEFEVAEKVYRYLTSSKK